MRALSTVRGQLGGRRTVRAGVVVWADSEVSAHARSSDPRRASLAAHAHARSRIRVKCRANSETSLCAMLMSSSEERCQEVFCANKRDEMSRLCAYGKPCVSLKLGSKHPRAGRLPREHALSTAESPATNVRRAKPQQYPNRRDHGERRNFPRRLH